jgi:hypothetical protein
LYAATYRAVYVSSGLEQAIGVDVNVDTAVAADADADTDELDVDEEDKVEAGERA